MAIDRTKPGSFEISIVSDGVETSTSCEFYGAKKDKVPAFLALCAGLEIDVMGGELDEIVKAVKKRELLDQLDDIAAMLEKMLEDCEDEEDGE